ncbi:sco1 domain-containing protein [Botrytis cinerea]
MSNAILPTSRKMLSTISKTGAKNAKTFGLQCQRLSTICASRIPRGVQNKACLSGLNGFNGSATGVLFLGAGAGLIFYFRYEKARMERKRIAEAAKGVGRPKVGGPFELLDHKGGKFSSEDMKGKYSLVYFGFTHCPDICPEELDKMAQMIDLINNSPTRTSSTPALLPIFITCDPARDTPAVLATYLAEFHPSIIGLTGTWEQIKDICKKYRVYFSTPEGVQKGQDYLVDHSIYFYLMDPEGDFVEAIGRQHSPEQAARIIQEHVGDWKR